ncbi:hypothetical protein PINS_up002997 [Pythium insidiosum]|nr:hypothetical protein PINS_up002997 [Pythium insidiosum]
MVIDLREEMDASLAPPSSPQAPPSRKQAALANKLPTAETRATFLIRTLPRDYNPTPVTATTPLTLQPSASSSSLLLSPRRGVQELVLNSDSSDVSDNPFDDLTEDKLRQLSGKQDLSRVTTLQLSVDASKQSLEVIGELLPSLQQLRLVNSSLGSFRDLGTSLHALLVLHVPRCGLRDLDGISALTGLQELYVPHNAISDISPLTMHEELRVVDLESNCIVDVGQIEQLAFCPQLTSLSLLSNPVCKIERFRQIVSTFVPQLVSLDRVELSREDQQRLPDDIIDAAIPSLSSPTRPSDSGADSVRDDYGSTLTHGTDIVFAGNVTSALRRRRSETEGDNDVPASRPQTPGTTTLERPSTPARESITATLDRAHELDRQQHKSRDAILHELRAWRLETAGASQVGVVALDSISPAPSPERRTQQRPPRPATHKAIGHSQSQSQSAASRATERRPQTSAGVLRGAVREAFVDTSSGHSTAFTLRTGGVSTLRTGGVSTQRTTASTERTVDILVLDDGPSSRRPSNNHDASSDNNGEDSDDMPCSPRKSARGVFSPMDAGGDDLQLLLLPTPRSRSSSRRRADGNTEELEDQDGGRLERGTDADSDSDDEDLRRMARALKQRRPPPQRTTPSTMVDAEPPAPQQQQPQQQQKQQRSPFLDVAASLQAIDEWREQMDEPSSPSRGPACAMSDEQLASWLRERPTELKTRDAFRRFFRGISEPRLTRVLQSVFREQQHDKIRRRLQLMQGFFGSG